MAATDYMQHQQWADATAQPVAQQYYAITADYARSLTKPTDTFLCPLTANNKGIDFCSFRVRTLDPENPRTLFEVARPEGIPAPPIASLDDSSRFIRYQFGPEFLDVRTIGTNLEFNIGAEPLHDFMMIERHYFRDVLIQSFEFSLPFVIPGTRNTWEMIYTKPELNDEWKAALIAAPWESRSDSFYFVEGQLVMHNRAEYSYAPTQC
jgi:hypothetical protein